MVLIRREMDRYCSSETAISSTTTLVLENRLKVPKRAIIIDENQQTGVYVRSGNVASFRKIKQIFSEPADYVICEEVGESGYLRMFDDIIVGGRGLYDGKIIG